MHETDSVLGALPPGWTAQELGDVADFVNGRAFKPDDWEPTGLPIIRIQNLNGGTEYNFYSGAVDDKFIVSSGDLLFSWSGNRGTSFGPHIWKGARGILNQHIFNLKNLNHVEKDFLYQLLRGVTSYVEGQAHGGSGIVHIKKSELTRFVVPTPPIGEQRKIAAILSSVDEAIEKTQAVIDQVQVVKKGLMQELLTRGLPGRHKKFKQTEIGEIPASWEVAVTGSACRSIVPGRNKPKSFDGDIPWITIPDIQGPSVYESRDGLQVSREELARAGGRTIPVGAVIMSCVGKFGIVTIAAREMVINQQLHGFVCDQRLVLPSFLRLALESQVRQMVEMAGQTTVAYLNKSKCESIRFPLPGMDEQSEIAAAVASSELRAREESQVALGLKQLKQALMSVLLTGELRVTP